ncbi:MAG: DnaJ domain-containing protein, partial [Eubacteriales bacterium]|nr:DnaJ domain-containing protein [Eubacteriales bacterium]
MTDPYRVLNINSNATDEEVKQAYRKLAKRYHPDNYINNELADLAAEKMKEINAAYDEINRLRSEGVPGGGFSGGAGFSGGESGSDVYSRIRILLNSRRINEAEVLLQRISVAERNAEWHFLNGLVLYNKGWLQDARVEVETACRLDPYNAEYRAFLDRFSTGSAHSPYGRTYSGNGCSGCDVC